MPTACRLRSPYTARLPRRVGATERGLCDTMTPFTLEATSGRARAGRLTTAHGEVRTPVFMPVGTAGVVKATTARDLVEVGAQIILANTYHLMLRPGDQLVAQMGGLHGFT